MLQQTKREYRDSFTLYDVEFKMRNFKGGPDNYNPNGGRLYALIYLSEELADKMSADGYRVKIEDPEKHATPRPYIRINLGYHAEDDTRPNPKVFLIDEGASRKNLLNERTIHLADDGIPVCADITLRPSENKQHPGQWSLWIQKAYITLKHPDDELDKKYAYLNDDEDEPEESEDVPFN